MNHSERIFLIGFMGAGKSTLGKMLAAKLEYQFIDLDAAIELIAGKSINSIFSEHGENYFRELERKILHQLKDRQGIVVATGGGCAAHQDNLAWMKENGLTIFLNVQPGALFHRLAPEKLHRPLIAKLTDVELMEFIIETLSLRQQIYKQADYTIDGEVNPNLVLEQIIKTLHHQSFSGLEERTS